MTLGRPGRPADQAAARGRRHPPTRRSGPGPWRSAARSSTPRPRSGLSTAASHPDAPRRRQGPGSSSPSTSQPLGSRCRTSRRTAASARNAWAASEGTTTCGPLPPRRSAPPGWRASSTSEGRGACRRIPPPWVGGASRSTSAAARRRPAPCPGPGRSPCTCSPSMRSRGAARRGCEPAMERIEARGGLAEDLPRASAKEGAMLVGWRGPLADAASLFDRPGVRRALVADRCDMLLPTRDRGARSFHAGRHDHDATSDLFAPMRERRRRALGGWLRPRARSLPTPAWPGGSRARAGSARRFPWPPGRAKPAPTATTPRRRP